MRFGLTSYPIPSKIVCRMRNLNHCKIKSTVQFLCYFCSVSSTLTRQLAATFSIRPELPHFIVCGFSVQLVLSCTCTYEQIVWMKTYFQHLLTMTLLTELLVSTTLSAVKLPCTSIISLSMKLFLSSDTDFTKLSLLNCFIYGVIVCWAESIACVNTRPAIVCLY